MIVDCHTHIWESPGQLGSGSADYLRRQGGKPVLPADPASHLAASQCADLTFVIGFTSRFLGAHIPNEFISEYVQQHPDRLIGLAGIDPFAPDINDQLARVAQSPSFCGITLSPASQDFHPSHSRAMPIYRFCSENGLLVLVHQGTHFWAGAKMEYAKPYLWDEVLREFPQMRMVLAHLGYPWIDETIALLGKHTHLFADVAGLIRRPWHAYNALVQAHQYAVTDKLLFGSDFPFLSASEAIESVYRLNEVTHGTRLPPVPRETLRNIIERDVPEVLNIPRLTQRTLS